MVWEGKIQRTEWNGGGWLAVVTPDQEQPEEEPPPNCAGHQPYRIRVWHPCFTVYMAAVTTNLLDWTDPDHPTGGRPPDGLHLSLTQRSCFWGVCWGWWQSPHTPSCWHGSRCPSECSTSRWWPERPSSQSSYVHDPVKHTNLLKTPLFNRCGGSLHF